MGLEGTGGQGGSEGLGSSSLSVSYEISDEKYVFLLSDTDSSQVINWGDFYLVTKKVRGIYGADSVQMEYARKSLKALWDGLVTLADRNHDDQVTMDEWIQVLQSGDFQHEPKWFADYGNFIFKLMDVSRNTIKSFFG